MWYNTAIPEDQNPVRSGRSEPNEAPWTIPHLSSYALPNLMPDDAHFFDYFTSGPSGLV